MRVFHWPQATTYDQPLGPVLAALHPAEQRQGTS